MQSHISRVLTGLEAQHAWSICKASLAHLCNAAALPIRVHIQSCLKAETQTHESRSVPVISVIAINYLEDQRLETRPWWVLVHSLKRERESDDNPRLGWKDPINDVSRSVTVAVSWNVLVPLYSWPAQCPIARLQDDSIRLPATNFRFLFKVFVGKKGAHACARWMRRHVSRLACHHRSYQPWCLWLWLMTLNHTSTGGASSSEPLSHQTGAAQLHCVKAMHVTPPTWHQ